MRDHLRAGRLLAYPTETVYGIGGPIDARALDALHALKGSRLDKSFLVLVPTIEMALKMGLVWNQSARNLAAAHWPGPLTLVLRDSGAPVLAPLRRDGGGIGVRQTSHEALVALLEDFGEPITSSSANTPGDPPALSATQVESYFGPQIRTSEIVLLDGGILPASPPSTVVDCTTDVPRILRHGVISEDELWGDGAGDGAGLRPRNGLTP